MEREGYLARSVQSKQLVPHMHIYNTIVERNVPFKYLSYKSEEELQPGQLVYAPIRNKEVLAMVVSESQVSHEVNKLKPISRKLPFVFSQEYIKLIFSFAYNTFNNTHITLKGFTRALSSMGKRFWEANSFEHAVTKNGREVTKPQFELDKNILVRIKYIIRSLVLDSKEEPKQLNKDNSKKIIPKQILIITPEKKVLDSTYSALAEAIEGVEEYKEANVELLKYDSNLSKYSKLTTHSTLETSYNVQIIVSSKSGIFLPFSNLAHIILLDESNSFYIQDQNSLYYDARDAIFLLSSVFNSQILFLSTLPSIRLHNLYSKRVLDTLTHNYSAESQKPPSIKIYERRRDDTFHDLFSNQILDDIGISTEPESVDTK